MRPVITCLLLLVLNGLTGCDAPEGPTLSGTISLAPGLSAKLGASDALFIIARKPGAQGAPLAVKKVIGMRFPMAYTFTAEDLMLKGTAFEGPVSVIARIRKSGNALLQMPGDMEGSYAKNPVTVGARGVDFAIDKVLQ